MTPDQIKEYIDAAVKHRNGFVVFYLFAAPLLSALATYIVGYLKVKSKDAATKEDIAEITNKVEGAKAVYAQKLEQLRADLLDRSHFGKVRYEREIKIYEDIWPKLSSLREAVFSLRPIMDTSLQGEETEESRKNERRSRYWDADVALRKAVEHNRPFYPQEIWNELQMLLKLSWGEAIDFRFTDQKRDWEKYWDKAAENSKAINAQVEKICEAIRT